MIERIRRYLASVRGEVQRVSWPSRREVITFTVLILLMVVVLGLYLFVVDQAISRLVTFLTGLF
ncbi:MAG TPA: preprotein translocase subunit SecE [Candidatus Acetothermia bacterium]|nr:preprotein translocase subunit SecE [Candidatus Acetothermia bacterium]